MTSTVEPLITTARTSPVFVDDSGRRALIVRFVSTLVTLGIAGASVALLIALVAPSAVPLP